MTARVGNMALDAVIEAENGREGALSPMELEVARLVIEAVNLEDYRAEDLEPEAPLFNDGLSLDSIDALEIALAVSQRYGFQLRSDDADNAKIFANLRSLAAHIETHRRK